MNFAKQYLFYDRYHRTNGNKLVHIITVPVITWTVFVWLSYTPPIWFIPNWGFLLWLGYSSLWAYMKIQVAVPAAIFYYVIWVLGDVYIKWEPEGWAFAIGIHIICWVLQIGAHHFIERNKPAFLTSLTQAFFMAPLFVVCETLFAMGLFKDIQEEIEHTRNLMVNLPNNPVNSEILNFTDAVPPPPGSTTRA